MGRGKRKSKRLIGTIFDADSLTQHAIKRAVRQTPARSTLLFVGNNHQTLQRKRDEALASGARCQNVQIVLVPKTAQAADDRICAWLQRKRSQFVARPRLISKDKRLHRRVQRLLL